MSAARSSRRGGWWGVAFVVTLAVSAGMVSLPTSAQSGAQIAGFYRAHAAVILVQQLLGVLSVVFFLLFAVAFSALSLILSVRLLIGKPSSRPTAAAHS